MAKKATAAPRKSKPKPARKAQSRKTPAKKASTRQRSKAGNTGSSAGDAFVKLLQSPLVADLVAVAATSALAALAEHGMGRGAGDKKRAGKAVKEAGKAAATAVGRRLSLEIDEIKKASKAKGGATK